MSNIDFPMLNEQYHLLIELISEHEEVNGIWDQKYALLDGLVEMLGDMLDDAGISESHGEWLARSRS